MKRVVVVGAGPAGLVAAAYLARRGYTVDVFEKRSAASFDPTKEVNHSFTIVLNYKGIKSIQGAGLSLSAFFKFPLLACVRHLGQTHHAFLRPAYGTAMNFERSELNAWLLSSVLKAYPSVKVHYDTTCTEIDFSNKEATFTTNGDTVTAKYDLLLGADGAGSAVRSCMAAALPGFSFSRQEAPLVYKRFRRIPSPANLAEGYGHGGVVHFYAVRLKRQQQQQQQAGAPVSSRMKRGQMVRGFLALVNHEDGSVSGGLSVYKPAMELLTCREDFESLLSGLALPLPSGWMCSLSATLSSTPWTWGGSWVGCSALGGPGVMLLGDAGHAVSPSLGQGCNAALEDVVVMDKVLDAVGGDLAAVPDEFNRRRLGDVTALVWLDKHARAMRGQQGLLHPCLLMYLAHMVLRPALSRMFPGAVHPPAMMRLWSEAVSYTSVKRAMVKDGLLLLLLMLLLLAVVAGVVCCPNMVTWWELLSAGLLAWYSVLKGSGMMRD